MGKENEERLKSIEKQIQMMVEQFPIMAQELDKNLKEHEEKDKLKVPDEEIVTLKLAIQQLNNLFSMLDQDYRVTRHVVFDYCLIKRGKREDFIKRIRPSMIQETPKVEELKTQETES